MIIINIDYIIKFKEEDNIAGNDNDANNNKSNNGNNRENHIYFSIIPNNTCSNLYLNQKIQNINNNHENQKYLLFLYNCVYCICVNNKVSHKVL